ncbi:MAG TPA: putative baseplate assembly protein, partial [Solibacterales bacterium]|nr:putative baseplate assembly protein [Bryobacterales bacterium]
MSDAPELNGCGCCAGIDPLTPADLANRPGLTALTYRAGTHASFRETMLAAMTREPGLRGFTSRDGADPAVALVDAWSAVLDVLTFYQERIANEGFLRTATERVSLLELVRATGYELNPGVAATTHLAFELSAPTGGAPGFATIGVGTKAQSLPGPGEKPQTFETVEQIEARSEWNAIRPRMTQAQKIAVGTSVVYFQGAATNLRPGDGLLFIGPGWASNPVGEKWDFRRVAKAEVESEQNRTKVTLLTSLAFPKGTNANPPAPETLQVYAFRQRANVFGAGAPDWRTLHDDVRSRYMTTPAGDEWPNLNLLTPGTANAIDLDTTYPKITLGSYVLLSGPNAVEVFQAGGAGEASRSDFALAGKTTRLWLTGRTGELTNSNFPVRATVVFGESERLTLAELPNALPVANDKLEVNRLFETLPKQRKVIVSGKRFRAVVNQDGLVLIAPDWSRTKTVNKGDELFFAGLPLPMWPFLILWRMVDRSGFEGFLITGFAFAGIFTFGFPQPEDPVVSELAEVKSVEGTAASTTLTFAAGLKNLFERASVVVAANVAEATHGETKEEALGSADASQPFQRFQLRNKPLTYVSAATATGAASTLEIRVNDVLWQERSSFYEADALDRVYVVRRADDGTVTVQFGDGVTAERPPSGIENVRARYRLGTGLEGMVKAEQISLLMTRPLGVKGVRNPIAATGGADPESRDDARRNAPMQVLTLGRVVSLQDFGDFAQAFAGIGKARADVVSDGESRLVLITVASAAAGPVAPGTALHDNLREAIKAGADPSQRFRIVSFEALRFGLQANVLVDPAYVREKVVAAVESELESRFGFAQREFGQAVNASE